MSGSLRITGGALARRLISVPAAADRGLLRPTSDKVREAIMSALHDVEGARVLDLFAGSGALGIECLSRGARYATFVERDRKSARVIDENLAALAVDDRGSVHIDDARRFLGKSEDAAFDLVFVDPPYDTRLDVDLRAELARVMAPGARLVVERDKKSVDEAPPALSLVRERVYGGTRVTVFQKAVVEGAAEVSMGSAAVYPGSFDPLTNGHVDIVQRGLRTFDRVVLAIANNPQKSHFFSIDERMDMAKRCLGHLPGIEFDTFDGLLVEYAAKKGVKVLLRGLRAVSDFEYEFQLASMNRKLAGDVETVFMMTSEESFYLSSRLVREVASFGANVREMVPAVVFDALQKRFKKA